MKNRDVSGWLFLFMAIVFCYSASLVGAGLSLLFSLASLTFFGFALVSFFKWLKSSRTDPKDAKHSRKWASEGEEKSNKRAKRELLISFVVIILAFGAIWYGASIFEHNYGEKDALNKSEPKTEDRAPSMSELFNESNRRRVNNGVSPMALDHSLNKSARAMCNDMIKYDYFEHVNPRTKKHGYEYIQNYYPDSDVSENLIMGLPPFTARSFFDSWMESEDHRAALLDPKYELTGFATCRLKSVPDEVIVVQHFAGKPIPPQPQPEVNNYYQQQAPSTCTTRYQAWNDRLITECN